MSQLHTSTRTNSACSARQELNHTPTVSANVRRRMMQRFDLCPQHTTAKLMLLYENGEHRTVFAFAYWETVHQIAGGDNVSVEELTELGP